MMIDPYWWIGIPALLLGLWAQMKLSSTYNHYIRQPVASGLSGAEAAREILDHAGLSQMPVNEVSGHLTDHYDPMKKALFLSSENYHGRSVAAVGVAAHEAGHALQHKAAYAPLQFRMMLVPVTRIASGASVGLFILGMLIGMAQLMTIGIIAFAIIAVFQIVTLPVEFNASSRAKAQLLQLGIVQPQESRAMSKVLSAAAMTYVAAMVQTVAQLLRFIMIARHHRN